MANFILNSLTSISLLIGGLILTIQGLFLYFYFKSTPYSFFKNLSKSDNRFLKVAFNIGILLGGFGVSLLFSSAIHFFGLLSDKLQSFLFHTVPMFVTIATCIYIWYLIPGYLGGKITEESVEELDIASSMILALLGFSLGTGSYTFIKKAFEIIESDSGLIGFGIQAVIISVVLLIQSIAAIVTYIKGNRSRNYLIAFISSCVVSVIGIVLGVVFIAI